MATDDLFLGIDIGTSGVRGVAIDRAGSVCAQAARWMPAPIRDGPLLTQEPEIWWHAVSETLAALSDSAGERIRSLAVDGTSGTLLLADERGNSLTVGLMYNDASSVAEAQRIKQVAPAESGGHGASAALAKLLRLQASHPKARYALHQADWIVGKLTGRYGVSDENNVLKLGYDVAARRWPDWFDQLGVRRKLLPEVFVPGESVAKIDSQVARTLGLRDDISVVAGSTDGVAAFLATGAAEIGDAVTSLGSTLVIKVLSQRPLFAPQFGIYSHRLGDMWLPGGASNSGGAALLKFFSAEAMQTMTTQLDPDRPTGLHYYPLPEKGERFPINDPELESCVEPRPRDDTIFFQGLLEGIAAVEQRAYRQLQALGAPYPVTVRSVGGGAANAAWTRIRMQSLEARMVEPVSAEAAYGSALLARRGSVND
jgi:D-ribulokinase